MSWNSLLGQTNFLQLTIPKLKEWAHSKHFTVAGKKAEIIERIEEYFENK